MGITSPEKTKYTRITPAVFTILAGAGAWVDTDVSATTGTDKYKIWAVEIAAATLWVGVRPNGSADDFKVLPQNSMTYLTTVSATGHVDLVRNPGGDATYTFIGYFS